MDYLLHFSFYRLKSLASLLVLSVVLLLLSFPLQAQDTTEELKLFIQAQQA